MINVSTSPANRALFAAPACLGVGTFQRAAHRKAAPQLAGAEDRPQYGGDKSFNRYSPLEQITRDNVKG